MAVTRRVVGLAFLAAAGALLFAAVQAEAEVFWAVSVPNVNSANPGYQPAFTLHNPRTVDAPVDVFNGCSGIATALTVTAGTTTAVNMLPPMDPGVTRVSCDPVQRIEAPTGVLAAQYTPGAGFGSGDATRIIGKGDLGVEHYVVSYAQAGTPTEGLDISQLNTYEPGPSYFMVVATEANTKVTISVPVATQGGVAPAPGALGPGGTATITLGRDEALQVISATDVAMHFKDLTGARITADKPIAVLSGSVNVKVGQSEGDAISEAMPPVGLLGKKHVGCSTAPTQPTRYDTYRIVAVKPGPTTVLYQPEPQAGQTAIGMLTLNGPGDWAELAEVRNDLYFESDQPVLIAQFVGESTPLGDTAGDPSMVVLTPMEKWTDEYYAAPPGAVGWSSATLLVAALNSTLVSIDGADASGAVPVATTNWVCYRTSVTPGGLHTVAADGPIGVTVLATQGTRAEGSYWLAASPASCLGNPVSLPGNPLSLTVLPAGSGQARIRWLPGFPGDCEPTEHIISRRSGGGAFAQIGRVFTPANEFLDSGLTECTAYEYEVVAKSLAGLGTASRKEYRWETANCATELKVDAGGPYFVKTTLALPIVGNVKGGEPPHLCSWSAPGAIPVKPLTQCSTVVRYNDPGLYKVTLTVTDFNGIERSDDAMVEVLEKGGTAQPQGSGRAPTETHDTWDEQEGDQDKDEWPDEADNCPHVPNVNQLDSDGDGVGNACDVWDDSPVEPCMECVDSDGDGVGDLFDAAPDDPNFWQSSEQAGGGATGASPKRGTATAAPFQEEPAPDPPWLTALICGVGLIAFLLATSWRPAPPKRL